MQTSYLYAPNIKNAEHYFPRPCFSIAQRTYKLIKFIAWLTIRVVHKNTFFQFFGARRLKCAFWVVGKLIA